MNKINIYSYIISILIFIFIFFIWYLKNYEIIITTDGLFYLNLSSTLINYSFNPYTYFKESNIDYGNILYIVGIYYFSFIYLIFENNWALIFILINIFFITLVFFLIQKNIKPFNILALFIFAAIFLISHEYFYWFQYTLIDIFNGSLIFITFLYAIKNQHNLSRIIIFFIIMTLIIFIRPTNIAYSFFIILIAIYKLKILENYRHKKIFILLITLSTFILTYSLIIFLYIFYKDLFAETYLSRVFTHFENGVIIHDRPETYLVNSNNLASYVSIYFKRLIYFFYVYSDSFSNKHIFLNIIYFFCIYIFSTISILFFHKESNKNKDIIFFSVLFILLNAHLCSITFIDYDWRYRIPSYPFLLMLSLLGVNSILRLYKNE